MTSRELKVPGAWEITPTVHADARGEFFEWFTEPAFTAMTGHRFDMAQANCSVSAAGVLRGVHFAELPPSQAKYVSCLRGAVYDVVVDIRVGSPTFGQWDAVRLDGHSHNSVYLSEGLGHAFLALEADSTVMYLCSAGYAPQREHTILATSLGIDWPDEHPLNLSERDAAAPTLEEVLVAGLLPTWADTRAFVEDLRARP
ncbi:MAG: dTDP-4-dehydrorhamnose 3,5-epimerase family protein [Mycobacterium sp.]